MIKRIIIYVSILLGIELALFAALVFTSMTDARPPAIAAHLGWTLKYLFGFPLVLLNDNYPYFLDRADTPLIFVFTLVVFNDLLLALGIFGVERLFRSGLSRRL